MTAAMSPEVEKLICKARNQLDDHVKNLGYDQADLLWSDDVLLSHLDEAQRQAAERKFLLGDSLTETVCKLAVKSGQIGFRLHPKIIAVARAGWLPEGSTASQEMQLTSAEWLNSKMFGWRGRPWTTNLALIINDGRATLAGQSTTDIGAIWLDVYRYPLRDPSESGELEIHARNHDGLIDWLLYKALSKMDVDAGNTQLARMHLADFERRFGLDKCGDCWGDAFRSNPHLIESHEF